MKRFIPGLKNSDRIRVIVDGVGFHTTVAGAHDICTTRHRVAVLSALSRLGMDQRRFQRGVINRVTGFASTLSFFDTETQASVSIAVQVDLV